MRYQVPQFIDIEDKIFGPLTGKQFVYLAGAGGFFVAIYTLYGLFVAILVSLPIVALAVALAFLRINELPFATILESAIYFYIRRKIFLWKKNRPSNPTQGSNVKTSPEGVTPYVPKLSESRLKDISWSLDIHERLDESDRTHSPNE
jgi:hypothetical protein